MTSVNRRPVVCLLALLCLPGCTSLKPVELADGRRPDVDVGQRVRVLDLGGGRLDFEVTEIDDRHIGGRTAAGDAVAIEIADIGEIERRQRSPAKTAALVGGIVVLAVVDAIATAYGAMLSFL